MANRLQEAIEELKTAHNEFLNTSIQYDPPAERKEITDTSMKEFAALMEKIDKGEMNEEQVTAAAKVIKLASTCKQYPKGGCSMSCIDRMLKASQSVFGRAVYQNLPPEACIGIMELSTSLVTQTMAQMLALANGDDKPWKVREQVHELIKKTIDTLMKLEDTIKAGKVLAINLSKVDTAKVKQFMN